MRQGRSARACARCAVRGAVRGARKSSWGRGGQEYAEHAARAGAASRGSCGGRWLERQGAGALAQSADAHWGSGIGGAASVSQVAAHSWMASEQHWAHYKGMQSRGAAQRQAGTRACAAECGGRRRERCELWVRGTTRERKQFGPLLLPTQSSAWIPHGTFEGAQKAPIVLEAFSLRQIPRQAARSGVLLAGSARPPSSSSRWPHDLSCQIHIARCQCQCQCQCQLRACVPGQRSPAGAGPAMSVRSRLAACGL